MHLIELIAVLEAAKVARGNIKLVDVLVHAEGDKESLADYSNRREKGASAPMPEGDGAIAANKPAPGILVTASGIHEVKGDGSTTTISEKLPEPETTDLKTAAAELGATMEEAAAKLPAETAPATIEQLTAENPPESNGDVTEKPDTLQE